MTAYLGLGVICNTTIILVVLEMKTRYQTALIILIITVITIVMRLELDASTVNGVFFKL